MRRSCCSSMRRNWRLSRRRASWWYRPRPTGCWCRVLRSGWPATSRRRDRTKMASSAPRYARAFAQVAESAKLDATRTQQQLRDFADTLAGSSELREFLENPSIEMPAKLKVLDAIAKRLGMYSQVRNFIAVILEHQRLA